MLSANRLTKDYGSMRAVDDVSFEVEAGEIVGFLGPNGAGKSTTLRMITGFLSPSAGSVRIGGIDALAEPTKARGQFGYMPEGVPLYPELRVVEYLRYRAELKRVPGKTLAAAEAALDRAGVKDAATRIIGQLSKGYRQRVGLADALLGNPPLLILDEPTSGLDPNQIRHVRELIRSFKGEKTVFLSTHILPEVEATCERVIIVNKGRVVGEGAPDSLRKSGGSRVRLRGSSPVADYEKALTALAEAKVVGSGRARGVSTLRVELSGDDAAERVFRAVAEAGLALQELRNEGASLEDVFASLTLADADPSEAGEGETLDAAAIARDDAGEPEQRAGEEE